MKRRLATIMVLALLISVLGGIAIFSSAETTYTADPIRMLLYGVNKYQYNLVVNSIADAYDYHAGIKQEIPRINVAADGTLSITGESGTEYTSANMAALVAVMQDGDFHRTTNKSLNIPGTKNLPAGWRYIGFNVASALTAAGDDTAAITSGIKAFLDAYKAAGGQLDGVMTDKADAATLNAVVFSVVEEAYPDAVMSAFGVTADNVWLQTGAANTIVAGNTSTVQWEAAVPGYDVNDYQKFLGDILRLRDANAATNGNVQMVFGRYDVGTNKTFYTAGIAHAILMGNDIVYNGIGGSYMHPAAKVVQFVNSLVGFSDREPLSIANSKNDLFVISGMHAAGRNVYLVTPADFAKAQVNETEEGIVIDMGDQTIGFAGGKIIADNRANTNTTSYWVETEADVKPVIVSSEDRLLSQREKLTYEFKFNGNEGDKGYWAASQGTDLPAGVVQDGAVLLFESRSIRHWATISTKFGTLDNTKGKVFGFSMDFTLPENGLDAGAVLNLIVPMTGGGPIDGGIALQDGVLSVAKIPMEMFADIEGGKTYVAKCNFDFTIEGSPVMDYYIYDAEGEVVAQLEGRAGNTYHENHLHSIGFSVQNQGMDPVALDNFKCYWVQNEVFDLSVYDVATGAKLDAAGTHDTAIAYRLDWMNICVAAKTQSLVAGHYDENGDLVTEETLATLNMVPGADGFVSGVVELKAASVCLYLKQSNGWTSNLTCEDVTYGEKLNPKATAALGTVTYVYATAADGEYTATAPVNAGTYYVKAVVAGTNEYATLTSEPVKVTIAKAALEVTAEDKIITYGDALTAIDVTFFGFVNGEDETVLSGELAAETAYVQFANVGEYVVTPAGLTSDNYEITFVEGTLIVEQKEIGIQWGNLLLPETGTAQKPTATATGAVNGDELTLVVSGEQTAAGSGYIATVTTIEGEKAENYKLPENVTATFSIGQAFVLNVNNGKIENTEKVEVGDTVTITAEAAPAGKVFAGWEITGIDTADMDLTATSVSFVVTEGSEITVKALYKAAAYTVIVNGVETQYEVGQTVTVSAEAKEGFVFLKWNIEGVQVDDETAETISFQMPAGNVTVNAEYRAAHGDEFPVAAIAALAIFSVMGMAVLSFRKRQA